MLLKEHPATRFPADAATFAPGPAETRGLARDLVRLLVARPDGLTHARFADLADHLAPGDLVVVNDSATVPAQLDADSSTRGAVVVHVAARPLPGESGCVVELRTAPGAEHPVLDAEPGEVLSIGDVELTLLAPHAGAADSPHRSGNRLWRARTSGDLEAALSVAGRPIAYGYLDRGYDLADYQSVFALHPGSAEMASAGRPFTTAGVTSLVTRGIAVAPVTLHTGVSSQEAGEAPQAEWFRVSAPTARVVEATRAGGGRVVAVGTTVTRALESAVASSGQVAAASGWTERVVTPADPPRVVGGLVTGWHDPMASHLLLVEAVAGHALTQRAYDEASARGYLWHEFGDSALFLPESG